MQQKRSTLSIVKRFVNPSSETLVPDTDANEELMKALKVAVNAVVIMHAEFGK